MTMFRCWVYGDNVNTDVIFPGKYTYTLKTLESIASKALEDLDPEFAANVQKNDVIVAGVNWGCGSSREQAVTALKYNGIKFIIAESFSGLYFRNCINQGIHPIVCQGIHQIVKHGDYIEINRQANMIRVGESTFDMPVLSPSVQQILDAGGLVPMLRQQFKASVL